MPNNHKNKKNNNKKKKDKKRILKSITIMFVTLLLITIVGSGITLGFLYTTIKDIPKFNPLDLNAKLYENSVIYDENGTEIEKVQTQQFRTVIGMEEMSPYLNKAFIAVEDERFKEHFGVDVKGLFRAVIENIKARSFKQGASTITQQLARNIYLSTDKEIKRKIKEMYIAIEIEKILTKDQILEAYLNTIYLGQGAHGVQAASQTYFSKDAKDLSLAESAMISGITKHPSKYALFQTYLPESIDKDDENIVGEVEILGQKYIAVFNENALDRQRLILNKMLDLGSITQDEYNDAINQDMRESINPGLRKHTELETSYFNDYVKNSVINDLVSKLDYTKEEAENYLYTGGLKIYSTLSIDIQSKIEKIYDNFNNILSTNSNNIKFITASYDKFGNILDSYGNITLYKKSNLLDDESNVIIDKNTYTFSDSGDLIIKNNKINYRNLDIANYYDLKNNELISYSGIYLNIFKQDKYKDKYEIDKDNKQIVIKNDFFYEIDDFYEIDKNKNLLINSKYIFLTEGILQPQSAVVILDYSTGYIKGLVGGRGVKGEKIFDRATDAPRQPGSSIKPLSVYLPALDNNFSAASIIDDVPHYYKGDLWPKNWYTGYKGLVTLRYSVEQSINVSAVKVLEQIGINKSMDYLTKLGVINENDSTLDTFVTSKEAKSIGSGYFDENIASLSLGGMTKGLTPLTMTAAYGAIANKGVYTTPISYIKVVDKNGNTILQNNPTQNIVVSPKVSYIMTDILRSVVTYGTGRNAQIYNGNTRIPAAGKTGTTQNKTDQWFVGFTPYYSAAVWVGNDIQSIKLGDGSNVATRLWGYIMKELHQDLPNKNFEKPNGFISRNICTVSGKLATKLCKDDPRGSKVRSEIFIKGTEPIEYCDIHVEIEIDPNTGLLVNEDCPPDVIEYKVFIKRDSPYDPSQNYGIVPNDYKYNAPTDVSPCPEEPLLPDEDNDKEDEIEENDSDDTDNEDQIIDSDDNSKDKEKNKNNDIQINIFDIINGLGD